MTYKQIYKQYAKQYLATNNYESGIIFENLLFSTQCGTTEIYSDLMYEFGTNEFITTFRYNDEEKEIRHKVKSKDEMKQILYQDGNGEVITFISQMWDNNLM